MASDTELAWCAGFFDGEGCTSILNAKRDRYSYIRMSISQKYPELLQKFKETVEAGSIYKSKKREIYSWDCYKQEDVFKVQKLLEPYLGDVKRTQFNLCKSRIISKEGV